MELKQFINDTLAGIIDGVIDSQDYVLDKGAYIVPSMFSRSILEIEFDVAVTIAKSSGKKGGGELRVGAFGIGGDIRKDEEDSTVSRIQFKIPIHLPEQQVVEEHLEHTRRKSS